MQDVWRLLFERDGDVLRRWEPSGGASLKTWVSRVAGHHARTWLRNKRTRERRVRPADDPELESRQQDIRDLQRDIEQRDLLREVLRRVGEEVGPSGVRVLERLVEHGGGARDASVIASELDTSVAAVRKWRQRLRHKVSEIHAAIMAEAAGTPTRRAPTRREP